MLMLWLRALALSPRHLTCSRYYSQLALATETLIMTASYFVVYQLQIIITGAAAISLNPLLAATINFDGFSYADS